MPVSPGGGVYIKGTTVRKSVYVSVGVHRLGCWAGEAKILRHELKPLAIDRIPTSSEIT